MEPDARHTAIWQLSQTLIGHRLETVTHETEPRITIAGDAADGYRPIEVKCDRRGSDGDRLWFYIARAGSDGYQPVAETTRVTDAVVAILGERRIRI